MIGMVTSTRAAFGQRTRARTSGKAAIVPTSVPTQATIAATSTDVKIAPTSWSLPGMPSYHFVVSERTGRPTESLSSKLNRIRRTIGR